MILCYCKKCGRFVQRLTKELNKPCDYCQSNLFQVPNKYLVDGSGTVIDNNLKQQFIDEYIKSSPEFDQYLFDHRDEDLSKRRMENRAKLEHGKAILEGRDKGNQLGVECPYCHSKDTKKISSASKVVDTAVWGFFGTKRYKQWHCNSCGSNF